MSTRYEWICYGCGIAAPCAASFACAACGEPLSLRVLASPSESLFDRRPGSMWAYGDLLPIEDLSRVVSLGEGGTPLVETPRLALESGLRQAWMKNEAANPTGSFKDRQVSVGLSHARELGANTVAAVSSGNVACAAAAYASRAGLRAILFMHGHAAPGKIAQVQSYGGRAVRVDTPSAREAFDLCVA
ncbi:pyridoxal-phosphate dependent enzyme, partial [Candidatus Uhrbacteria bacterium]|nr:pyridoxal-phosphate dependent enzyme [Candidatus Uhrbacteria bacterium]